MNLYVVNCSRNLQPAEPALVVAAMTIDEAVIIAENDESCSSHTGIAVYPLGKLLKDTDTGIVHHLSAD